MLHSWSARWEQVESQLLVVGSQIASLTPIPALLLPITWAVDVQMAHARPFWTFKLQNLSNDTKSAQMQGDLTPTIAF